MKTDFNNDVVFTASVGSAIVNNVVKVVSSEPTSPVWGDDEQSSLVVADDESDFHSSASRQPELGLEHSLESNEPFASLHDSLLTMNYAVKMGPDNGEYMNEENVASLSHEDVSLNQGGHMNTSGDAEHTTEPFIPCKRAKLKCHSSESNNAIREDPLKACTPENQFKFFHLDCGHDTNAELFKTGCTPLLESTSTIPVVNTPIAVLTAEEQPNTAPILLSQTPSTSEADNGFVYTLQTQTGQVLYITDKNLTRTGTIANVHDLTPLTSNNDNVKRGRTGRKQACSKVLKGIAKSARLDEVVTTASCSQTRTTVCGDENCTVNYAVLSSCVGGDDDDKDKTSHNMKERKRRARIKDACDLMRQLVPGMSEKTDKATVFEYAARYIYFLKGFVGGVHDKDFLVKYSPY